MSKHGSGGDMGEARTRLARALLKRLDDMKTKKPHDVDTPSRPRGTDPPRPKTDPPKTGPSKPKTDPPKTDPPKTDPPKTDPPKTDPSKPKHDPNDRHPDGTPKTHPDGSPRGPGEPNKRTDDLRHPDDLTPDQHRELRESAANAPKDPKTGYRTDGDSPSAGRHDPEVERLTDPPGGPKYDKDGDPSNPSGWPDADRHPEGFADPNLREPATLPPGDTIDRFGNQYGRYTSPTGEPYADRALPDSNLDGGYRQYEVQRPLPVWRGDAAPAQGQNGGAVQHYLPYPVVDLVRLGYLRQTYPPV